MRQTRAVPTGVERTFGTDEIIVSKTDPKGIITYANDAFCRVSGYAEEDLVGQPHNVVRHPDMPRALFKLLWDTISGGKEVFAYVLNLAADGAHYWALAHVTPSFGPHGEIVGYHSNRRCPDRAASATMAKLYTDLRAEERRHPKPADALAASTALLQARVTETGGSYDELLWSITPEVVAR